MSKYQQTFVRNVRRQFESWLNNNESVQHKDVYRFLHSIAGTSKTIELFRMGEMAQSLLDELREDDNSEWNREKLQRFFLPLISLLYYEEYSGTRERNTIPSNRSNNNHAKTSAAQQEHSPRSIILLIDDNADFIMYAKEMLEQHGWGVLAVADPDKAISSFYDLNPDCVIINYGIQDKSGIDVLDRLKDMVKHRFVPTIMISEGSSPNLRIKSYQLGVDDFITIPFDHGEFIARIHRQIERKHSLQEVMIIDELTRVFNRNYLQKMFDRVVHNLRRKNETCGIVLVALDDLKKINESHGFTVGDQVLKTFADILRNRLFHHDVIIRYSGDEFLLFLPDNNVEEAKNSIERILKDFSKKPFYASESNPFYCTFSAAVHEIQASQLDLTKNVRILFSTLYESKREGRGLIKIVPSETIKLHKKRIHVGVVDDDPIIRTMLTDLISKSKITEGFSVNIKSFKDGMDFLESEWHLEHDEPYLIILDGMMPRMDGIEVLQKLRVLNDQERYKIIMLTSRKSEQDISRAIQLGADDYITKPFKLLELESRLGHLIKRVK